ncbi:MAG: DUF2842 domain-containing protein [Pseudomonadota bacterium]
MRELSYKARRRLSLFLLLVFLPAYIVGAVTLMTVLPRLPVLVELVVYIFLGVAWALPFKFAFKGVGKPDPDAPPGD